LPILDLAVAVLRAAAFPAGISPAAVTSLAGCAVSGISPGISSDDIHHQTSPGSATNR
jgi:hypothetical protein